MIDFSLLGVSVPLVDITSRGLRMNRHLRYTLFIYIKRGDKISPHFSKRMVSLWNGCVDPQADFLNSASPGISKQNAKMEHQLCFDPGDSC